MNRLRIIGIVGIAAALAAGVILQTGWRLLATQRPAQITRTSTTTLPDGTVAKVVDATGYSAEIRWWLIWLLIAVFIAGLVCLFLARRGRIRK
jgi:hypothetical protein